MIVRSDVSVYQIFQRFRLGKPEFPGRWTAKPYSHLPTFSLFRSFLTLFSSSSSALPAFPSILLLSSLLRARVSFSLRRFLGNWIVASNSTQDRGGKEAAFLCFFHFVFGPVETFVSGVASTFSPMLRRSFSSPQNLFG